MSEKTPKEVKEIISEIKDNRYKVCLFGIGSFAKTGRFFLDYFGIENYFYVDNDEKKWGTCPLDDGIICRSPDALLSNPDKIVVFVFTFYQYVEQIKEQLKGYGIHCIITESEILQIDDAIIDILKKGCTDEKEQKAAWNYDSAKYKRVENKEGKKTAVYTCVTGNYDESVYEPYRYFDDCDYYYISDVKPGKLGKLRWIDINELLPGGCSLDDARANRYIKINGNHIFDNYKESIYIDGNIRIKGLIHEIEPDSKSGYVLFPHVDTPSLYAEGVKVITLGYEKVQTVSNQLMRYYNEGFPIDYGLFMNGVIIRDNDSPIGKRISDVWWNEYINGASRDQLSFCYAAWKCGCTKYDIKKLEGTSYNNNNIDVMYFHRRKKQSCLHLQKRKDMQDDKGIDLGNRRG